MKLNEFKYLIESDLYRYCGKKNIGLFLKYLFIIPGFKYTFLMRSTKYFREKRIPYLPVFILFRILLNHYQYKYGISIPYDTNIGAGLYIGHFGGIFVNYKAIIGKNCNINQDVSIGAAYGGNYPGVPKIGDNVYIAPGAKLIGGITIGNNVAIGANSVVTKSIPDNAVVVGIPGEVISYKGSENYVINTTT